MEEISKKGTTLKEVSDCSKIKGEKGAPDEVVRTKVLLCKLGKSFGYNVDIERYPESEVEGLAICHDVLWYSSQPKGYPQLLTRVRADREIVPEYRKVLEAKAKVSRHLIAAFEIESSDIATKYLKGDISNLSKLPLGVIVVKRRDIYRRIQRALLEFRTLHGVNNVIVVTFENIEELCQEKGIVMPNQSPQS